MEIDTKNIESVNELDFYEKSKKFFLNKSVVKKGLLIYEVNEKHHTVFDKLKVVQKIR